MSSAKQSVKRALALSTGAVLSTGALCMVPQAANAAAGDSLSFVSAGPIRDGGDVAGTITLGSSSNAIDPTKLVVAKSDLSAVGSIATPTVSVAKSGTPALLDGDLATAGIQKFADGLYHYSFPVLVDVNGVATASFAVVEDLGTAGTVDTTDPRTQVTVTPAGAPASVSIAPASQSTVVGTATAPYVATFKDASGAVTQLLTSESFTVKGFDAANVDKSADLVFSKSTITGADTADGTASFTSTPVAPAGGTYSIKVSNGATPAVVGTASLTVNKAATITADELDIVTGADTWNGFNGGTLPGATTVRVDQTSVKLDIAGQDKTGTVFNDAGKAVTVTATSATAKFGGKTSITQTVILDGSGKGSITITPDAGTVTDTTTITLTGDIAQTLNFARPAAEATGATATTDAGTYVTKVGSPTSVTVTVKDQFGNTAPAGTQVALVRSGRAANAGTTARATVGADGKATFSLPDAGTVAGTESLQVLVFTDQFDASGTARGTATIKYTVDGVSDDYQIFLGANDTSLTTYNPATTILAPITDTVATANVDSFTITTPNATSGAATTITADNGALILKNSTALKDGAASQTGTTADTFRVVGTKDGVVTVTVNVAGRTETAKFTVAGAGNARNIDVTGPAKVTAGSDQTYSVKITDAFGNPVAGSTAYNVQLAGPVTYTSFPGATNAQGVATFTVRVTDSASDPVIITATGVGGEFGAAANRFLAADTTDTAPGLPASAGATDAVTSTVVNIKDLQDAVAAAQVKVDAATIAVSDATDAVTLATLKVDIAQGKVADAKKDVAKAKKALKKAKKQGKGVKAAKAKLAKKQRALADAKDNLKVAKAELAIANNKLTTAQATLVAAQQELADAQAALDAAQQP